MKMDQEFFRSDVTDEWNTPAEPESDAGTQTESEQPFGSRKKRAHNAFRLVAPVAAVVTAGIIIAAQAVHCPICGQEDCRYYHVTEYRDIYERSPNQAVFDDDIPDHVVGVPVGENRMGYFDFSISGINKQAQQEVFLFQVNDRQVAVADFDAVDDYAFDQVDVGTSWWGVYNSRAFEKDGELQPMRCGHLVGTRSQKKSSEKICYIELLYLPDGSVPAAQDYSIVQENDLHLERYLLSEVQKYPGCDGLWVRAYSNTPAILPQDLIEKAKISVGSTSFQTFSLGGTMELDYSSDNIFLHETMDSSGIYFFAGQEERHPIFDMPFLVEEDFSFSRYIFGYFADETSTDWSGSCTITFSKKDYREVVSFFNDMFDMAPASRHYQLMYFVPLESETINGITYDVYLQRKSLDFGKSFSNAEVWFVPQQEPTCSIRMLSSSFGVQTKDAEIAPGTSLRSTTDAVGWDILSHISLR